MEAVNSREAIMDKIMALAMEVVVVVVDTTRIMTINTM